MISNTSTQSLVKQKSRRMPRFLSKPKKGKGTELDLRKSADAAGAQYLVNHATLFHHSNLLQVGAEGTTSSILRKATVITKGGDFATMSAFSHEKIPFVLDKFIVIGRTAPADTASKRKQFLPSERLKIIPQDIHRIKQRNTVFSDQTTWSKMRIANQRQNSQHESVKGKE